MTPNPTRRGPVAGDIQESFACAVCGRTIAPGALRAYLSTATRSEGPTMLPHPLPDRPDEPDPDRPLRAAARQLELLDLLDDEVADLALAVQYVVHKFDAVEHLVMGLRISIVGADGGEQQ